MTIKDYGGNSLFNSILIFLALFSSFSLWGQEYSQDEILEQMRSLKNASVEEYVDKMQEISRISQEYIVTKEKECSGEFSSLIINDNGETVSKKKKLSKKEKNLCLYMLINFRIQFTKISFSIRKNHLKKLHQSQLQELDELAVKRVGELEKLAKKFK